MHSSLYDRFETTNANGDAEVDLEELKQYFFFRDYRNVYKPMASQLDEFKLWTEPIWMSTRSGEKSGEWRTAEKVILHRKFQRGALIWKGYDFALLKFLPGNSAGSSNSGKGPKGTVAPACLASRKYNAEKHQKNTYFTGYGRRYIPHCLTDGTGPVKYGVCGRPDYCNQSSRTRNCGLDFLYKGQRHNVCLTDEDTPSAADPMCVSLRKTSPELNGEERPVHVLDDKKEYLTTCYPQRAPNGWCTTRAPGIADRKEPGYTEGWGFCSDSESQKFCNEFVPIKQNSTAYSLSILNPSFCRKQIGKNLNVEQPDVTQDEYADLEGEYGVFCVGRNYSHQFQTDLFYQRKSSGHFSQLFWSNREVKETMKYNSPVHQYNVSGGPVCFGDSGGPIFQLVYDQRRKLVRPVIIGVFSFLLWGTCEGEDDPAYFGRINFVEDWIKKYVGNDVCWAGDI